MNHRELLLQSTLAGVCIGIGGALFLAIENKIIGALFFTLGLFTICTRGFHLFTGRVGYLLENDLGYAVSLVHTWAGNLAGTQLVALLLANTRMGAPFIAKAAPICAAKLDDGLLSIFILSVFCNLLMYIAVDGYRNNPHTVGKYVGLFLCVAGFILAGFEHCIANMFYFGMGSAWSAHAFVWLLVMTAGNAVGGLLLPICSRLK